MTLATWTWWHLMLTLHILNETLTLTISLTVIFNCNTQKLNNWNISAFQFLNTQQCTKFPVHALQVYIWPVIGKLLLQYFDYKYKCVMKKYLKQTSSHSNLGFSFYCANLCTHTHANIVTKWSQYLCGRTTSLTQIAIMIMRMTQIVIIMII